MLTLLDLWGDATPCQRCGHSFQDHDIFTDSATGLPGRNLTCAHPCGCPGYQDIEPEVAFACIHATLAIIEMIELGVQVDRLEDDDVALAARYKSARDEAASILSATHALVMRARHVAPHGEKGG